MSDVQQEPDWWLGGDGKWYPPVAAAEPDAAEAEKKPRSRRRLVVIGLLVVLAAAGGAFLLLGGGGKHQDIVGAFTLKDTDNGFGGANGRPCHGTGGYSDIQEGTQITLSDGNGKVIGTSALESGKVTGPSECDFVFTIKNVPKVDFYKLEISHRGQLSYSYSDLQSTGFLVFPTLGS